MKATPGDVFEVEHETGFRYVQLRACDAVYGDVLDVDTQTYADPTEDPNRLTFSKTVIFPLSAASNEGLNVKCIGRARMPKLGMPAFKVAVRDANGEPIYWWIWKGGGITLAPPDCDLDDLPDRRILRMADLLALWHSAR